MGARKPLNSARQKQPEKKVPHCLRLNLIYKITSGEIFNLLSCIISWFRISKLCVSKCFSFPQLFTGPCSSYQIYEIKAIVYLTAVCYFLRYLCADIFFWALSSNSSLLPSSVLPSSACLLVQCCLAQSCKKTCSNLKSHKFGFMVPGIIG